VPRRRRRNKRRDLLTLKRDLMLSIGPHPGGPRPQPGSEEWEALRACWEQHRYDDDGRDRYREGSWGWIAFEVGDVEGALKANPLVPVDDD
jgi:hypothetical protein